MRIERRLSTPRAQLATFFQHRNSALLLLLVIAPALLFVPITHDEIWHIWLSDQMLGGARLYRDIVEVNPPLWFWMGLPLAATGLGPRTVVIGFFILAIFLSLLLTPARDRLLVLIALVVLPLHDFGQREHFTLIATVPYVFLIAQRARGDPIRHAFAIGLFAAFGFALKPYFIAVPIALELMLREHRRPELAALVICAIAYAIAVPLFAPDYLTTIVPMLREVYGAFGGGPGIHLTLFAFGVALVGAWLGRRSGDATTRALFLAGVAFLPSVIIQAKGWSYQSVPARGFLFLAIAIDLIRVQRRPFPDALLFGAALSCFLPVGVYYNGFTPEIERHLADVPRGASIVVLANNPSVAWPAVYDHGLRWDLPEMSTWQVQALARRPDLKPLAQRLVDVGLAKHPDIVVIDLRADYALTTLSLLPRGYLRDYRLHLHTRRFKSYVRTGFITAP